jgi:hypothetical protein
MVAGALRHALAPGSDNDHNLIPRVRVRGRSGRCLALYGSLTEPSGDRSGETVIVIGPAKPEEVAWLNVAAYGLRASIKTLSRRVGADERVAQNGPYTSQISPPSC